MFKIVLLFLFNFPLTQISYSQAPDIEWQKCFGGPLGDQCQSIQPTTDGGSIACGNSQTLGALVIKINNAGSLLWQQNFPGKNANSIQQTTDGGYIIAGYTPVAGHGNDFWVAKLNSSGVIVWQRTFGGSMNDMAHCVRQTANGGFIVAGRILSSDGDVTGYHGNLDGWVVKLDSSGDLIWQKALGGSDTDAVVSIEQTFDGGYIIGGLSYSTDGDVTNTYGSAGDWVIKLDGTGNIIWQKTYGSPLGVESIFSICITQDGNYTFVSGCYENAGDITGFHGAEDLWVVKVNTIGNIIWQKSIGGTLVEVPRYIFPTNDGGCIAAGYSSSNDGDVIGSHGASDILLAKLSPTGILEWTKLLGGNAHDRPGAVYQTTDNSYIIGGLTGSNNSGDVGTNNGQEDYWIVKLSFSATPVVLANFTAVTKSKDVFCKWATLQEQNADRFIIERSEDGINYITAGTVATAGNSSSPLWYNFTDEKILLNLYDYLFYRLKMVDMDGSYKYSETILIKLTGQKENYSVVPNPADDYVEIIGLTNTDDLAVYDLTGKPVSFFIAPQNNKLNIQSLAAGMYLIQIKNSGIRKAVLKFIKK